MDNYSILPFCIKQVDDAFFVLPKRRQGKTVTLLQTNEVGHAIISLLESNTPIPLILPEICNEFDISNEDLNEVKHDIDQFLCDLSAFGLLTFSHNDTLPPISLDAQVNTLPQIGMLERIYKQKSLLYKAFLEITYECNLRCRHCYRTESVTNESECAQEKSIDLQTARALLDELEAEGAVEVFITGGEAFLHPDALKIIEYASRKNFLTTILTNGNALENRELVSKISQMNLFDIRVSIYGAKEAHDRFTNRTGSFDKSMRALENLNSEMGIGTAVYVATSESVSDLEQMIETFESLGINYSINPVITPTSEGALFPLKYRLSLKEYEAICKKYQGILNGSTCTAGLSRLRITPCGDVNGCELLPNSKLGNLHQTSLSNILKGERRRSFLEELQAEIAQYPCPTCQNRQYCNFCPGAFYLETRRWGSTSPYRCGMTETKARTIMETNPA